jgi:hypothetical protein
MPDDLELIEKLEQDGLLEEETELEPTEEPQEEPVETKPEVDVEAIRAEERTKAFAEAQTQYEAVQRQESLKKVEEDDTAELEKIAELQMDGEYVEAEKRRVALIEKRNLRTLQAQYGSTLTASGTIAAIADARAKLSDVPQEVASYIDETVRDLGIQGEIPQPLVNAVKTLAYGKAAMAGKFTPKQAKTIKASGSESATTQAVSQVPAHLRADASEFAKHFGQAALNKVLKEAS